MSKERANLTNEAVKINGSYIEDMIEGYATLKTTGRRSLEKSLDTYSVGVADGEKLRFSKFPSRAIKVEFLIHSASEDDLIRAINQLNNILNIEDCDFVFNDEPDKYFTGSAVMDGEVEKIQKAASGSFTIFCGYPFKRSVAVTTLSSDDAAGVVVDNTSATFTFDYTGTYPARPVLRAEFAAAKQGGDYSEDGDCGFVAFLDDEENIIQLGNPEVVDVDQYAKNGTLANSEFSSLSEWTPTSIASASITDQFWNNGVGQTQYYAKPSGTASLTRRTDGAVNTEFDIVHRLCVNSASETGVFEALAQNNGTTIAGFRIKKTGNGTSGTVEYILNDRVVGTDAIDLSFYNTHFGYCRRDPVYTQQTYQEKAVTYVKKKKKKKKKKKVSYVTKTRTVQSGWRYTQSNLNSGWSKDGSTVIFSVGNLPDRTFKCSDITNVASIDLVFNFSGTMHTNALHSCSFIAGAGVPFAEIPNVFTAGDIVEADCNDANVYLYRSGSLEGHLEPQYGALGNDWEDFEIKPGRNVIRAVWSNWVNPAYKPRIQILFNEVYL